MHGIRKKGRRKKEVERGQGKPEQWGRERRKEERSREREDAGLWGGAEAQGQGNLGSIA